MKNSILTLLWFIMSLSLNDFAYAQTSCGQCVNGNQLVCAESSGNSCKHNCDCSYGRYCSDEGYCQGTAVTPLCSVYGNNCSLGESPCDCIEASGSACNPNSTSACACASGRVCEGSGYCNAAPSLSTKKTQNMDKREPAVSKKQVK